MTRAAILYSCPGDLTIADIEVDTPGPREVLIQTVAAGLCHSDLHFMEGKYTIGCPAVLGHESAGVVTAVGSEVSYVRPGDHVITCVSAFCGECEDCLSGNPARCQNPATHGRPAGAPARLRLGDTPLTQFAGLGSYSSDLLVHERALVKIDEEMPLDRAALIGCGVTTGLGAVFNTAQVRPGTTVAVFGCGGIGLNVVQGARLSGASRIIAVDRVEAKLELARQLGATDTVNAAQADPVAEIIGMTDGGVHYSFEAIGLKIAAEQAFGVLRRGGTATVIGMIPVGQMLEIPGAALLAEKKLQGSIMGSNRFRTDMPFFIDLYRQGRLKLDELLAEHIGLGDINDGYAQMKKGETARSVIMF
ncbi:MAG TPA: Zn-dependent alcohol dehydrogenase [Pseudonocardiaceae bacterium]